MPRPPAVWRVGRVCDLVVETPRAKSIVLEVPGWPGHRAGHHVDVRLTAPDGYQAERSYSIASAPEDPHLALTVERIDGGEVSPYLTQELRPGDQLELRGPIGRPFTWHVHDGGPLMLIAGGSGLVPLMAMLRHHAAHASTIETRLLLSTRTPTEVLYHNELTTLATNPALTIHHTYTRLTADILAAIVPLPVARPRIYVSGPTAFVGGAAAALVELGHVPRGIRAEDFGPNGRR